MGDSGNSGNEELDLSLLSYEEWLAFLFNREVHEIFSDDREFCVFPKEPLNLVHHFTRLCSDFPQIVEHYDWPHIDQGLWGAFMDPCEIADLLIEEDLPLQDRVECIVAMKAVFEDVVAKIPDDVVMEGVFFMWWDFISSRVSDNSQPTLIDTTFGILSQILQIDDYRCQSCALHGLGHLKHPGVRALVDDFLQKHRKECTEEGIKWIEQCRDGAVM